MADLAQTLGHEPPTEFATLPPEALAHLEQALRAARERRHAELSAAVVASLGHLPALLRGPVKRALGL